MCLLDRPDQPEQRLTLAQCHFPMSCVRMHTAHTDLTRSIGYDYLLTAAIASISI
jgi:hypothetical protein